jgi:TonB-linked SusC/RagA family outer membrane protein
MIYFWLLFSGFVFAENFNSQNVRVSLNKQQALLGEVLDEIERQTDYLFVSNTDISLKRKVSIRVKNMPVRDVLNRLFNDTDLAYAVEGVNIIITKKEVLPGTVVGPQQAGKKITGTVKDIFGEPVIGANVVERNAPANGTVTDVNGNFTLTVAENTVLQISYIGYITQEISVSSVSGDFLAVSLLEDTQALEEVVVVGYGTVKKRDLTGSVTSISAKTFKDLPPIGNSMLQGRVPGLLVRQGITRIRGINSILGSNDPLWVVDGNYGGNYLMDDVESVEVLKDASATAIYGSRGANGVIIVTTKRGQDGPPRIKVTSSWSRNWVPQKYDLMDPLEYAIFNNQVGNSSYSQEKMEWLRQGGGTDWQDEIFGKSLNQTYNLSINGGGKRSKYYISGAYSEGTGLLLNNKSGGNYWARAKVDSDITDRVSLQIEASASHGQSSYSATGGGGGKTSNPIYEALIWSPAEPVYEEDGVTPLYNDTYGARGNLNPIMLLTGRKLTSYNNNAGLVGNLKVKIIDGLVFDAKASTNFSTGGNRNLTSAMYQWTGYTNASQSSYENQVWLLNSFLTYSKTFTGIHNLSAMLGFEETKTQSQSFSATGDNLQNPQVSWYNLGNAAAKDVSSAYSNHAMRSYFARLNYNYGEKYYFTGTYRADGSSRYRDGNQFGYFPSFAFSWRLSEESFLKDNTEIFQNLKLRGGWGVTGSDAVGAYSSYSPLVSAPGGGYSWGIPNSIFVGYKEGAGGNPNLQWEESKQTDIGLDATLLNGRLSLTLDYYIKHTDKLLNNKTIPGYNGGGTVPVNLGQVNNTGVEAGVNYQVMTRPDFSWDLSLNGAINRNKVIDIGDEQERLMGSIYADGIISSSPFIIVPGSPIGSLYGFRYLGIWQQNEAAEAALYGQQPGDYHYYDKNGNYQYDGGDYEILGCSNPKFTWGFNNHFSYKNFDLNILLEGVHGRDVLNLAYAMAAEVVSDSRTVTLKEGRNRWSLDNPQAKFAKAGSQTTKLALNSDQWIQDASYLKVRNITLAYLLPKQVLKFASLKFYVSAVNMLTFTKYKGFDPEVSSATDNRVDTDAGVDWFANPTSKSMVFGLSLEY